MRALLIDKPYLDSNSILSGQIDWDYVKPIIFIIQDTKLEEVIGTDLYQELISQVNTPPVSSENQTLLNNYIAPFLMWHLVVELCMSRGFTFSNAGNLTSRTSNADPVEIAELGNYQKHYSRYADIYSNKLIRFLQANTSIYPAYTTNEGVDKTVPVTTQNNKIGLFLDPTKSR